MSRPQSSKQRSGSKGGAGPPAAGKAEAQAAAAGTAAFSLEDDGKGEGEGVEKLGKLPEASEDRGLSRKLSWHPLALESETEQQPPGGGGAAAGQGTNSTTNPNSNEGNRQGRAGKAAPAAESVMQPEASSLLDEDIAVALTPPASLGARAAATGSAGGTAAEGSVKAAQAHHHGAAGNKHAHFTDPSQDGTPAHPSAAAPSQQQQQQAPAASTSPPVVVPPLDFSRLREQLENDNPRPSNTNNQQQQQGQAGVQVLAEPAPAAAAAAGGAEDRSSGGLFAALMRSRASAPAVVLSLPPGTNSQGQVHVPPGRPPAITSAQADHDVLQLNPMLAQPLGLPTSTASARASAALPTTMPPLTALELPSRITTPLYTHRPGIHPDPSVPRPLTVGGLPGVGKLSWKESHLAGGMRASVDISLDAPLARRLSRSLDSKAAGNLDIPEDEYEELAGPAGPSAAAAAAAAAGSAGPQGQGQGTGRSSVGAPPGRPIGGGSRGAGTGGSTSARGSEAGGRPSVVPRKPSMRTLAAASSSGAGGVADIESKLEQLRPPSPMGHNTTTDATSPRDPALEAVRRYMAVTPAPPSRPGTRGDPQQQPLLGNVRRGSLPLGGEGGPGPDGRAVTPRDYEMLLRDMNSP